MTTWLTDREQTAWVRLIAVVELLPGALETQLRRDAGLSHFEYFTLAMLSEAPDRTLPMTGLARRTNSTLSRLSHVVRRLAGWGFVVRAPSARDGRITEVGLTEAGYAKVVATAPGHVATVRALVVDALTAEQVDQLTGIMDAVLARVDPAGAMTDAWTRPIRARQPPARSDRAGHPVLPAGVGPLPDPLTPGVAGSSEDPAEAVRRAAITLTAIAQSGLHYADDEYDVDRYHKIAAVARDLLAVAGGGTAEQWRTRLGEDRGYATPKVDVRGALVDDRERLLLMRERTDARWSLPGGWADPLDTPAVAVEREVLEETGHGARAVKLVGCWDRDAQGHLPKLPFSIYKLFFLCDATGEVGPPQALETLEIGWFGLDELPVLSTGRVNAHELGRIVAHHRDRSLPTEFD